MIFLKETICILNGETALSTKAIAPTTVVTAKTSVKSPNYTSFVIYFKDRLWFCSETERAKLK